MIEFKGSDTVIPLIHPDAMTHIYREALNKDNLIDLIECSIYSPTGKTTLGRIYQTLKESHAISPNCYIYVVVDSALEGQIFRCGNYDEGKWQEYAHTLGWA